MFEYKPISMRAVPRALSKAERYRLLNEPRQAESICRDILHTDRENQKALATLLLSLTDQFGAGLSVSVNHAREVLPRLKDEYERTYYEGVIFERWAKAQHREEVPGYVVYEWFLKAMSCYEQAQELAPSENEDAVLRWNTCARILRRNSDIRPRPEDEAQQADFHDEVPFR